MTTTFTNHSSFATATSNRFFEDYIPGSTHEFGQVEVTDEEVLAFARKYDPQYFHTDPVKARDSMFGGLIASGFHTAAMVMRLLVDHYLSQVAGMGSPGLDELRWLKPVRPGDQLRIRITIAQANRSRSKPDRGLVTSPVEVLNQKSEVVMTFTVMVFVKCRSSQ